MKEGCELKRVHAIVRSTPTEHSSFKSLWEKTLYFHFTLLMQAEAVIYNPDFCIGNRFYKINK